MVKNLLLIVHDSNFVRSDLAALPRYSAYSPNSQFKACKTPNP